MSIVARIKATNNIGSSSVSSDSTSNALVATVPLKPSATPYRGASSS